MHRLRLSCAFWATLATSTRAALTLTTQSVVPVNQEALHDFLATPANWPKVVLSSCSVDGKHTEQPCTPGVVVEEVFGLPPLLPLSVQWTCVESDKTRGVLIFESASGLEGVAQNCKMQFQIDEGRDARSSEVTLDMSYDATSPLAVIAAPVLSLDNALALKVLAHTALMKRANSNGLSPDQVLCYPETRVSLSDQISLLSLAATFATSRVSPGKSRSHRRAACCCGTSSWHPSAGGGGWLAG